VAILIIAVSSYGQNLSIGVTMSPNPSPYLSDWQTRRETVVLQISNMSTQPVTTIISARILRDGELAANTKPESMKPITIAPGASTMTAESILPSDAIKFYGDIDKSAARTGQLPGGSYQLCISLISPSGGTLSAEKCAFFTIRTYQAPSLLSPAEGEVVGAKPVMFRWTPVSPTPSFPISYRLRIVPVYPKQNKLNALEVNPPIYDRTVVGLTQQLVDVNAPIVDQNQGVLTDLYADNSGMWTVTAYDEKGMPIGPNNGTAEPRTFTIRQISVEQVRDVDTYDFGSAGGDQITGRYITDTDCVKLKRIHKAISDRIDSNRRNCDSLRALLNSLLQQLALAQQALASALADLDIANNDLDKADKDAKAAQDAYDKAMKSLNAFKSGGIQFVPYSKFGDITKNGYATVGGAQKGGGVAVQGSLGDILELGDRYGREKNGSSKFWNAFRAANKAYQNDQDAKERQAIAKERQQQAQKAVDDLKQQITDLEAQIAAIRAQLDDCEKHSLQFELRRDTLVAMYDSCLKILDKQRKAGSAIDGAKNASDEAKGATGKADDAVNKGKKTTADRPGATNEDRKINDADKANDTAKNKITEAERLQEEAKRALAGGDPDRAKILADSAKKLADSARTIANGAESNAQKADQDAKRHPTKAEIEAQKEKERKAQIERERIEKERQQRIRIICMKYLLDYMKENQKKSWLDQIGEFFSSLFLYFSEASDNVAEGVSEPTDKFKELMEKLKYSKEKLEQLITLFNGLNTDDPIARAKAFGAILDIASEIAEKVPGFKEFIGFYAEAYNAAIAAIERIANELDKPYKKQLDDWIKSRGCNDQDILKWEGKTTEQILEDAWNDFDKKKPIPHRNRNQENRIKEYFKQQYLIQILKCCLEKVKMIL
jgi:colicin import membrane protein